MLKPLILEFVETVWGLLKSIPWQVWAVILALALAWGYGHMRYEAGYEQAKQESSKALAKEQARAEKARKELEDKYIKQAEQFIAQRDKEYAKRDKVISDWQSGRLRLKPRFVSKACPASGDNAGTEAGLLGEDVQFLIREASRADAIVRQLTACQGLIKDGIQAQ